MSWFRGGAAAIQGPTAKVWPRRTRAHSHAETGPGPTQIPPGYQINGVTTGNGPGQIPPGTNGVPGQVSPVPYADIGAGYGEQGVSQSPGGSDGGGEYGGEE